MKHFILLLSFVIFSSFFLDKKNMTKNEYVPARYIVISDEITNKTATILSKRHNMNLLGTGGGLADCVNILSLSFQIIGPKEKEELREILVDSVETFLLFLNSNEELRPHLSHYPFTSQGIQIELFIMDPSNRPVKDPNISIASTHGQSLIYMTIDSENCHKFKSTVREDF
jgi:hypothetical protein